MSEERSITLSMLANDLVDDSGENDKLVYCRTGERSTFELLEVSISICSSIITVKYRCTCKREENEGQSGLVLNGRKEVWKTVIYAKQVTAWRMGCSPWEQKRPHLSRIFDVSVQHNCQVHLQIRLFHLFHHHHQVQWVHYHP